jgi:hypothetical protein
MSPFELVVVFILTSLFVALSAVPLLLGQSGKDPEQKQSKANAKSAHYRLLHKSPK